MGRQDSLSVLNVCFRSTVAKVVSSWRAADARPSVARYRSRYKQPWLFTPLYIFRKRAAYFFAGIRRVLQIALSACLRNEQMLTLKNVRKRIRETERCMTYFFIKWLPNVKRTQVKIRLFSYLIIYKIICLMYAERKRQYQIKKTYCIQINVIICFIYKQQYIILFERVYNFKYFNNIVIVYFDIVIM